jgi:hypothetical protein
MMIMIIIINNAVVVNPYATSRKLAGSRPDEENEFFFNLHNLSGRTRPWGLFNL